MIAPAVPTAAILMVDDRVENLVALEAVLQPLGHRLVRATSGRAALRELLRMDFAVILMDVQMPEMNGFETVSLIKARPRSRDIPIIFLTAVSMEEHYVSTGYSAGAVDYIFKPFQPEILRSKVNVFIDLYQKQREIERQGELLRASERRELELRHRAAMLAAGARYAQVVDSAMDPIVSVGADHRIKGFNGAAQRTFRSSAGDAVGKPIEEFLRGGLRAATVQSNGDNAPGVHDGMGLRPDGTEFEVEFTLSTLETSDGTEHTLILRDVSERRRTADLLEARSVSLLDAMEELRAVNDQLSQKTRDLEHAIGVRSRFYASMSHELRTPINAILGYSSLLLDGVFGNFTGTQRESVERTKLAANHLMELVNDILDLSKVEAGKMDLRVEPVAFPDLVHELLATVSPLAEQHGVELKVNACQDLIMSDPRRLRQVILNLLSNAIKFGNGKPVEINCLREEKFFVVEVRDHGPGIAAADQERIFEEFVQLDSQQKPGTGLGLPISRRLAELLGGTLSVESVVGEGSMFRLSVPVDAETPSSVDAPQALAGQSRR